MEFITTRPPRIRRFFFFSSSFLQLPSQLAFLSAQTGFFFTSSSNGLFLKEWVLCFSCDSLADIKAGVRHLKLLCTLVCFRLRGRKKKKLALTFQSYQWQMRNHQMYSLLIMGPTKLCTAGRTTLVLHSVCFTPAPISSHSVP